MDGSVYDVSVRKGVAAVIQARSTLPLPSTQYHTNGYRPGGPPDAPLQSTHSSTSDTNSTSTSYADEPQSISSPSSPAMQPVVHAPAPVEVLTAANTRPSPLSQAHQLQASDVASDAASHLDLGPAEDDSLTMRRGRGNLQPPRDSAALKSSPNQSSPLAGPPLADGAAVGRRSCRCQRRRQDPSQRQEGTRQAGAGTFPRPRQEKGRGRKGEEASGKAQATRRQGEKGGSSSGKKRKQGGSQGQGQGAEDARRARSWTTVSRRSEQPAESKGAATAAVVASPATITPRGTPRTATCQSQYSRLRRQRLDTCFRPRSRPGRPCEGPPTPVPAVTSDSGSTNQPHCAVGEREKKEHAPAAPQARHIGPSFPLQLLLLSFRNAPRRGKTQSPPPFPRANRWACGARCAGSLVRPRRLPNGQQLRRSRYPGVRLELPDRFPRFRPRSCRSSSL